MLKTVRLKLLPSVANCLSWSAEGSLAVIAGEDVIILVPYPPPPPRAWLTREAERCQSS